MINWDQLRTVLWLRWRLTRNQWARGGNLGAAIAALLAIFGLIFAAILFCGAMAVGIFALRSDSATPVMIAWDVITLFFLLAWMVGLLTELQRSETIDLQRLMHLPVRLGQIFAVNYVASHVVFSVIVAVPAMIGLAIGLAISHGPAMLLLIPLALSVVFMITAWTYCLRGWLATLMANPRRKRSLIVFITMFIVLIAQLPNIYFNVFARKLMRPSPGRASAHSREQQAAASEQFLRSVVTVQKFVPPLWLPVCAKSIAEGRPWPALAAFAGCAVLGAAGLRRAYRSTVRFYSGDSRARIPGGTSAKQTAQAGTPLSSAGPAGAGAALHPATSAATPTSGTKPIRPGFLDRSLPGVPDEAAAVALATLRSMMRAPEVKMQWATALIMTVVFCAMMVVRAGPGMPPAARPFVAVGLMVMMLFMLVQSLGNQFGFDRGGFRAFVLSPVNRRWLLLGKNIGSVPIAVVLGLALAIFASFFLHLGPATIAATLLQLLTMLLLICTLGNLLSIMVPYRIRAGSMKPTKMPAKAQLALFFSHMLFPLVMAPAAVPTLAQFLWDLAGWPHLPVNLLLAAAFAAGAAVGYWKSLGPLSRLLQRRESVMLDTIGVEIE